MLVHILKDTMVRMNLPITNCRGQCYDGAPNMAGTHTGVAMQILSEESRATYTHCYGHALNLAASDTVKMNRILRDTLDTALEILKLLKYSPRQDAIFASKWILHLQHLDSIPCVQLVGLCMLLYCRVHGISSIVGDVSPTQR